MKKYPKISIITVCYNSKVYLEQCIQSIVNQNYQNLEYLVIDGGSTDGTLDIISKYRDKIDYFISEPDKGISDAFNKGIAAATGDIIGIINSDDFMMPNVLVRVAEEYEEGIDVYRGYELLYYPIRKATKIEHPNNQFSHIPIGNCICHEASFISRKIYKKVGGYKVDFKYSMDVDLFMRLKNLGIKHKFIDVCVLTFRVGGASSDINKEYIEERKKLIIENEGSLFDAFIYVNYHKFKQYLKTFIFKIYPK